MNNFLGYTRFLFAVFFSVFMVNACTEEIPELSNENRIYADSLIRVETRLIVEEIDSLCKLAYSENFNKAVDSVSQVRLKEIEKYIPQ